MVQSATTHHGQATHIHEVFVRANGLRRRADYAQLLSSEPLTKASRINRKGLEVKNPYTFGDDWDRCAYATQLLQRLVTEQTPPSSTVILQLELCTVCG